MRNTQKLHVLCKVFNSCTDSKLIHIGTNNAVIARLTGGRVKSLQPYVDSTVSLGTFLHAANKDLFFD